MKILLIEDDKDIAELVAYNCRQEKWECEICAKGSEGFNRARSLLPDLIILDLMLPDIGGLEICRMLKADPKTGAIPILMLTAKGEEHDRIAGFEVGTDDYLTKPFSPRELVLRAKAILYRSRSSTGNSSAPIFFGMLVMDPEKFRVTVDQQEVHLTAIEFKLLQHLLQTKGRVATRDVLLDQVWGYEVALTTRTVDVHIKRLRAKLGRAGDYIETIRGIGYRCRERSS